MLVWILLNFFVFDSVLAKSRQKDPSKNKKSLQIFIAQHGTIVDHFVKSDIFIATASNQSWDIKGKHTGTYSIWYYGGIF